MQSVQPADTLRTLYVVVVIFITIVIITLKASSVSLYDAWNHRTFLWKSAVILAVFTFTPSYTRAASVLSVSYFWLLQIL